MLIEFSVGNYRSFSEKRTLSMEATSITEFPQNVVKSSKGKLLKCAVLYGANSSGKSNFLRAMSMMKKIISTSFKQSSNSSIPFDPFLLDTTFFNKPSFFEIVFLIDNVKYRYGFETTATEVVEEWLFETIKRKEYLLFVRAANEISVSSRFQEGANLESRTRNNTLFLTVIDQFNGKTANKILRWFNRFNIIDGVSHSDYRAITFHMLEDEKTRKLLTGYYKQLNLGFEDINIEKEIFDSHKFSEDIPEDLLKQIITDLEGKTVISLTSSHHVIGDVNKLGNGVRKFDVRRQESSGTNKIIDLSGVIFDTLITGGILVIDELDAKLHPFLARSLVELFQNVEMNVNAAQLIFATHNTNLLSQGELRRDQIYFTEKNESKGTDLYALVEYKVRKDSAFEKDYIQGKYGATPFFKNLTDLKKLWPEQQK